MRFFTIPTLLAVSLGIIGTAMLVESAERSSELPEILSPVAQTVSNAAHSTQGVVSGLFSMAAFADEAPVIRDLSNLLRIGEREFNIVVDGSVSTNVLSQFLVRKVGFGRVSRVTTVSTPTGTYSSDGLGSMHVLYPGIEVYRGN